MKFLRKYAKKFVFWTAKSRLLYIPRKLFIKFVFSKFVLQAFEKNGAIIHFNRDANRMQVLNLTNKIKSEVDMLLNHNEAYQIFMAVKNTQKIKGDIAEVGVFQGGSAKLICEAGGDLKEIHLFDTFEGLPYVTEKDSPKFFIGKYAAQFEVVKVYLKNYRNISLYKGIFPETAEKIKSKKFSFVHLDVDVYQSTLDCLEFFYKRMVKGGIILSHDYISDMGVKKSFDEFFKDKPEPIIELAGSQCIIVKI